MSSYSPGQDSHKGNFVARNELVAALSDVVVVTEAALGSGTRHTIAFAQDQGVTVMAVPGPITSPLSQGTNLVLRSGAAVVTSVDDILRQLGIKPQPLTQSTPNTKEEQHLLMLLRVGFQSGEDLLRQSGMQVSQFNQTVTLLEISGKIVALGGNQWGLA